MRKRYYLLSLAAVAGMLVFMGTAGGGEVAEATAGLVGTDCVKCHAKEQADITANGQAHEGSVGCQDCHNGHPPVTRKIIPLCSQCHQDKPHFKLKECLACHKNPHTPKVISFGNNVTEPCITCHTPQIAKLREFKSRHTSMACSYCHDAHGKVPLCTQCHKPHDAGMVAVDCRLCHQAHMPLVVAYGHETPNKSCAACHKNTNDLLSASKAKHSKLLCVTCHKEKHKAVPKCQDCHGVPHPAAIMSRFPKCAECHNIAHNLNSWENEVKKNTPQAAKPAAAKKLKTMKK